MISQDFDVDQAIERTVGLEHVIWFDRLEQGLQGLTAKTGIEFELRHDRRGRSLFEVSDSDRQKLKEMLYEE